MAASAGLAELSTDRAAVSVVAPGMYRVEAAGKQEIVYVAGPPDDRWAFWNGHVFRLGTPPEGPALRVTAGASAVRVVTAPMPATVIKVAPPGSSVKKGDIVVILEAMKMEVPIRSPADGTIKAVHCHEGALVRADQTLIELGESSEAQDCER